MSLPELTEPSGLPSFLTATHAISELGLYAQVPAAAGHGRSRRVRTATPRTITVSRLLTAAQMVAYDTWFETALLAGQRHFAAQIADFGPTLLYWDAVWVAPYQADPITAKDGVLWKVSGQLFVFGQGSVTAPVPSGLTAEYGVALLGAATIVGDSSLAAEFSLPLQNLLLLQAEFSAYLASLIVLSGFLLEDSSGKFQSETDVGYLLLE